LKVRFGLSPIAFDIHDFIEQGMAAEEHGFDSIWIADHYTDLPPSNDKYEPWTLLATIGAKTESILLGTLATDCIRHHPATIAHIAASLDNITHGRAILGIGAGEAMNTKPYGMPWEDPETRTSRLKETLQLIRLLWKSTETSPVDFEGRFFHMTGARLDLHPYHDRDLPIYVAALGSRRTLNLVGELGDGWLPWFNTPESFVERRQLIDDAAVKARRSAHEIEKTAVIYLCLTEDRSMRKKVIDSMKAEIVVLTGPRRLAKYGHVLNVDESSNYSYQKCLASETDAKRARDLGKALPDTLAERFLVTGSPKQCVEQMKQMVDAGAQHLILRDMLWANQIQDFHRTMKIIQSEIIPALR
jgi:alkanesulfonate monooxygenase SsuD/methylene tetrahydromethanopterin reductase-like flavin-dependent oxidoreductase (luciferase family)